MNGRVAAILCGVLLGGCGAPFTVQRVSEAPAVLIESKVKADYVQVQRRILDGVAYCFMEQPTRRQLVVRDHRDKTARTGEVVLADVYGKHAEEVHWVARTQALPEGTRLQVYVARDKWRDQAELVSSWVRGELDCGRYAPPLPPVPTHPEDEELLSVR